jgi:hypothetical protein
LPREFFQKFKKINNMGIGPKFSKSSFDSGINDSIIPDPNKYDVLDSYEYNGHLAIKIKYLGVSNYEGVKILVYRDANLSDLLGQNSIDPHFSDNKKFRSPFARFEPTDLGWLYARNLISDYYF